MEDRSESKERNKGNSLSKKRPNSVEQGKSTKKIKSESSEQSATPSIIGKKNKPKKAKVKTQKVKLPEKNRDFPTDLEEYLRLWSLRDENGSNWKFNKILQAWALENCFNKEKVNTKLLKILLPYISTVRGGAVDRLNQRVAQILSTDIDSITNDDEDNKLDVAIENESKDPVENESLTSVTKSMFKRAKTIQKVLCL